MTTPLDIGILVTGAPPPGLVERYGRFDDMMRRMLGDGYRYRSYDVQQGEAPAHVQDHAAYLITGSSAGAYDALPWIGPLQAFIQAAHGRTKLVGICFGHQIMAQALGGRVERSSKGWGLGLHRYDVVGQARWMADDVAPIAIAASHQDQVVAPPSGATVLAASAFTPYAGLSYGGGESISMQFHPEFEHAFVAELVGLRRPLLPEAAVAEEALASLMAPGDAARVAAWIRGFLDGAASRDATAASPRG